MGLLIWHAWLTFARSMPTKSLMSSQIPGLWGISAGSGSLSLRWMKGSSVSCIQSGSLNLHVHAAIAHQIIGR